MPRSSRHKQVKQQKHSSKDVGERSDSEEDGNLKSRNSGEEGMVRVSVSGEKREIVSQFEDGNGGSFEDIVCSKRRKEWADVNVSDRWKCVEDERGKRDNVDGSQVDSGKSSKMKVLLDSNSNKSSRRNESSAKEKNGELESVSWEVQKNGGSKLESKFKTEKDSPLKEVHQYKDSKEKERGVDRDRKVRDMKRERSVDVVPGRATEDSELSRKQRSQTGHIEEERSRKRKLENDEWQLQDDLCNPEPEKELEKRLRRRRDDSVGKDKCQGNIRDGNDGGLSLREDWTKTGKDKDERSDKYKYKDDRYRDKYREDVNRNHRHGDEKRKDEHSSRDHPSERPDTKHFRDESKIEGIRHKKSRPYNSDHDGSPHLNDRGTRYKDKEKMSSSKEDEGHCDLKSLSTPECRSDIEKKPLSDRKISSHADVGRSQSRNVDVDSTVSSGKWKASPHSSAHVAKHQYRQNSRPAESKYRDSPSEERFRSHMASRELTGLSGDIGRASERRSLEKPIQKDEKYSLELANERPRRLDVQASPMRLIEKSPSSSSIDRRYSNRSTLRRSLDIEEIEGRSGGSKDARDYSTNEDRRSWDLPSEKPDDFSLADGDTLSASSSYNRTSHLPGNSFLLPPPALLRNGVDIPSVLEEDSRGKPSNRYRRYGDSNVGRGVGNTWKGVPRPSPVTNGVFPYPHGPPPGGFHPVMTQFPSHLFNVRPSMDFNHTGLPYHAPDADKFSSHGHSYGWQNQAGAYPHLHGWDGSHRVFGDETQVYGNPDWNHNRHLMSSRGWGASTELWKGQNSGVNMEFPSPAQKDDHLQRLPSDEIRSRQSEQQLRNDHSRPGSLAESIEIMQSSSAPPDKDSTKAPVRSRKEADNISCFSHVYLSKLDMSEDLTHPELYNNCMSLSAEDNAAVNKVVEHDYMEERTEAGVKISNITELTSFFPKINESIFQRAMSLYKKQTEEMKIKHCISSFPEPKQEQVQCTEEKKLEPVRITDEEIPEPTSALDCENPNPISVSDQDNMIIQIPVSSEENLEEPLSIMDQEMVEAAAVLVSDQQRAEIFPTSDQGKTEEETWTHGQNLEEPITAPVEDKERDIDSTSILEEVEVVEDRSVLEQASMATKDSPSSEEDINRVTDSKINHGSSEPKVRISDAMCDSVGFSDGSSERCEALLMQESIECRLVSQSRIHNLPENTH